MEDVKPEGECREALCAVRPVCLSAGLGQDGSLESPSSAERGHEEGIRRVLCKWQAGGRQLVVVPRIMSAGWGMDNTNHPVLPLLALMYDQVGCSIISTLPSKGYLLFSQL